MKDKALVPAGPDKTITPEEYQRQQAQLAGSGHGRSSVDDLPEWLRSQYTQSAFDDAGGGGEWFQNGMRDSTGQGVFNANSVGSDNNLQGGGDARGYHITDPSQIRDDPWYGRVINGEYIDDTQNRQIQAAHRQAVRGRGMTALGLVAGGGLLAESGLLGQAGVGSSGLAGDAEMALANQTVAGGGMPGSAGIIPSIDTGIGAALQDVPAAAIADSASPSSWAMEGGASNPFLDIPEFTAPPEGGFPETAWSPESAPTPWERFMNDPTGYGGRMLMNSGGDQTPASRLMLARALGSLVAAGGMGGRGSSGTSYSAPTSTSNSMPNYTMPNYTMPNYSTPNYSPPGRGKGAFIAKLLRGGRQ